MAKDFKYYTEIPGSVLYGLYHTESKEYLRLDTDTGKPCDFNPSKPLVVGSRHYAKSVKSQFPNLEIVKLKHVMYVLNVEPEFYIDDEDNEENEDDVEVSEE